MCEDLTEKKGDIAREASRLRDQKNKQINKHGLGIGMHGFQINLDL